MNATKKMKPFNFLNGSLYPRTEGHSIAGQSKKCNQCRKPLAGYVDYANRFFPKVKRFFCKKIEPFKFLNDSLNPRTEQVLSPGRSTVKYIGTSNFTLSISTIAQKFQKSRTFLKKIYTARRGKDNIIYSWHEISKKRFLEKKERSCQMTTPFDIAKEGLSLPTEDLGVMKAQNLTDIFQHRGIRLKNQVFFTRWKNI